MSHRTDEVELSEANYTSAAIPLGFVVQETVLLQSSTFLASSERCP